MSDQLGTQLRAVANALVADAPAPAPLPSDLGLVTQVPRRNRAVIGALAAATLVTLSLIALVVLVRDEPDRAGIPRPANPAPTTTTTPVIASPKLTLPTPSGWYPVEGTLSLSREVNPEIPFAESAVATMPLTSIPSRNCDVPVAVLESLGPTDALVYVRTVFGTGYGGPPPPASEFVPTEAPENAYTRCLSKPPEFLQKIVGFARDGYQLQVWTATGRDVSPETQQQLVDIVAGLSLTVPTLEG